jgi:hypothetical protein
MGLLRYAAREDVTFATCRGDEGHKSLGVQQAQGRGRLPFGRRGIRGLAEKLGCADYVPGGGVPVQTCCTICHAPFACRL